MTGLVAGLTQNLSCRTLGARERSDALLRGYSALSSFAVDVERLILIVRVVQ
jgi:hypothetical protein